MESDAQATRDLSTPAAGRFDALRQVGALVLFAVLPALTLATMLAVGLSNTSLSADFHHEIYPQAKEMLEGHNPYPPPDFDPTVGANYIWPPLVAYLAAPLTVLPLGVADVVMLVLGLACFVASLWIVGLRDWRVYGLVAMWPQIAGEMRVSHLTPPICLLLALAWRSRDNGSSRASRSDSRPREVLHLATRALARLAGALRRRDARGGHRRRVPPPSPALRRYRRLCAVAAQLGRGFDQDSYTLFGLIVQTGGSETAGRIAMWACGPLLLAATWRYRSFTLAIAAALTISPIVWLDYFALAALPLAIARPRLSWIWFLPLATWGLRGAGPTSATPGTSPGAPCVLRRLRRRVSRRAGAGATSSARRPHGGPAPHLGVRLRPRGTRTAARAGTAS